MADEFENDPENPIEVEVDEPGTAKRYRCALCGERGSTDPDDYCRPVEDV